MSEELEIIAPEQIRVSASQVDWVRWQLSLIFRAYKFEKVFTADDVAALENDFLRLLQSIKSFS